MFLACKYGSAASYGAAKAGVVQLTRSITVNYAQSGVRANCVCPGSVQTDLNTDSNIATGAFDRSRWFPAPIPGRADPDEIAGAIAFLASESARCQRLEPWGGAFRQGPRDIGG